MWLGATEGLVAGRTGVVGDRLTVLNPLITFLTHVEGALPLQLTVLVVGRSDSILEERARDPFASSFQQRWLVKYPD